MPLFIFISAYLVAKANSIEKYGAKQYIGRRFTKLFVPYLGLSVLGFIPKILMSNFINDEVKLSFSYFVRTILVPRENVWGHFWFIPMIFVFAVISVGYTRVIKKYYFASILMCLLSFGLVFLPSVTGWLGVDDIKNYLFWYLLGLIAGTSESLFSVKRKNIVGCLCLAVGITIFVLQQMRAYNSFVALFMVFGILLLCFKFDLEKNRYFSIIGKHSFTIFLLSWPAQSIVEIVCSRILNMPLMFNMIAMFCGGIIVPLMVVYVIKKLSWSKTIVGTVIGM